MLGGFPICMGYLKIYDVLKNIFNFTMVFID